MISTQVREIDLVTLRSMQDLSPIGIVSMMIVHARHPVVKILTVYSKKSFSVFGRQAFCNSALFHCNTLQWLVMPKLWATETQQIVMVSRTILESLIKNDARTTVQTFPLALRPLMDWSGLFAVIRDVIHCSYSGVQQIQPVSTSGQDGAMWITHIVSSHLTNPIYRVRFFGIYLYYFKESLY